MTRFVVPALIRQPLWIKVGQGRDVLGDAVDLFAVHQKQRAELLGNLNSNSPQVRAAGWVTAQVPKFFGFYFAPRTFDTHHDQLLICTGPDVRVGEGVVKRTTNSF